MPLDRIGAYSGNMQEVRTLKLKCGACDSREWAPTIFQRDSDVAAFLASPQEQVAQAKEAGLDPAVVAGTFKRVDWER